MGQSSNSIRSISEQISISGQLSPQQIQQLSQQRFQSVMNLRSYQEDGADEHDRQRIESLGLSYVNFLVKPAELNRETVDKAIQEIRDLPKPLLIYCGSAMRATFLTLVYLASDHHLTLEGIREKRQSVGFDFEDKPAFNQMIEAYASKQTAE